MPLRAQLRALHCELTRLVHNGCCCCCCCCCCDCIVAPVEDAPSAIHLDAGEVVVAKPADEVGVHQGPEERAAGGHTLDSVLH